MRSRLTALRAALEASAECADTCCLDRSLVTLGTEPSSLDWPGLAALVTSDPDPATRALAAWLLRNTRNLSVFSALDVCLDATEPGLALPEIYVGQELSACPGATARPRAWVGWEQRTLAEICLETARTITGRYRSRDDYRVWRARYPEPRDDPQLWSMLLVRGYPAEDWVLDDLERHSRELFGRVLLTHPVGLNGLGLSPDAIAARAGLAPERLVAALLGPDRWPELDRALARIAYVRNLARGWRAWLGVEAGPTALARLWDEDVAWEVPWTRAWLAWALADAVPARRSAALRAGLELAPADGEVTQRLLELLAATDAVAESDRLGAWFTRPPGAVPSYALEGYQAAILIGLVHTGAGRPASLPAILRHAPRESARVLEAAAAAARAHGCPLPPTDCVRLAPRETKGGAPPEESARAKDARHRCREGLMACAERLERQP